MRILPLLLCLVFIAWFLVRDCKRRTSVSAAIWIPTFWLSVMGSRGLSQWLGVRAARTGPSDAVEGILLDQAFYLSLIVGSWMVASLRRVKWNKLFATNTAIALFYLYFAISVLWSDDPGGSFKRWFKDCGMVFVISVILSEEDPLEAIRAVYFRCACVLLPLSLVFIRYYGYLGRVYTRAGDLMYVGVATQKNSLGEIAMLLSLFLIWDYQETRAASVKRLWIGIPWDRLVLLLMGVWILNMSESKTSLMCLLIGLALMLRSGRLASVRINRMVLLGALAAPFLLLLTQQSSSIMAPLLELLGRDQTFTGRTDIWQHITATTVDPLFGAGFWNFWGGKGGAAGIRHVMQAPFLSSAHNGYLDIYLDGGLIGLALLFYLLLAQGGPLIGNFHVNRYRRLRFAVLIVAIIWNLSESLFARLNPLWFTTLLVLIDFPSVKADVGNSRERLHCGERSGTGSQSIFPSGR